MRFISIRGRISYEVSGLSTVAFRQTVLTSSNFLKNQIACFSVKRSRLDSLKDQLKNEQKGTKKNLKKPSWLKAKVPTGDNYERLRSTVRSLNLATVCEEAKCPNIGGMLFIVQYDIILGTCCCNSAIYNQLLSK